MEHFDALWQREVIDKCCIAIKAPKDGKFFDATKYAKPYQSEDLLKY